MTEQEEFEFRARLEAEAAARANDQRPMAQRIAEDVGDAAVNPFYASGAGGIGAMVLGPAAEAGYAAAAGRPGPTPDAASRLAEAGSPGQRWASKTGYGSGPGESVRDVREHYVKEHAPVGSGKISKKVSRATPLTVQDAIERERQIALEAQARSRARPTMEKLPQPIQATGRGVGAALEHTPKWMRRGVAGANLGYQGADAYNRALAGDVPGAVTSGAGALGSAMFLLPGKYKKAAGAGMAIGSHLLNQAMDEARENPEGYAKGRAVKGALEMFAPRATKNVRASEALGPHEGKYLYVTESDRMRSTDGDLGGPGFSKFQLEDPRYAEAKAAWGVGKKGKASEILNINKRFPEDKIIWSPLIGSPEQHRSNQHVYDRITDEFSRQASMGNLPQDLRQGMNERLVKFKDYAPMKLAGLDVANPEMLKQFGNTFERRAAIAEVLGGKGMGGRKGQIFDYPGIIQEMTDPMVVGAPTHSVGTRLFSLTGDVEHRPDLHSAFPYILKGEDKGVAFSAVPKELMLSDWTNQVRDFIGRDPGYMDLIRGVKGGHGKPNQFISEEFLRNLEAAGHKEGGLAHLAGGGEAFKNLVKAYKLFRTKPDDPETLYPLFVNANKPVPVGEWLQAEVGPVASSGKVKSKLGELAYRPGWHAGDLPLATHIGAKSDPKLRAPDLRPPNQVWAEVDMPADVDWQSIANQRAQRNKSGLIIPRTAHITDEIPFGGHYRYKTSPNMEGNWLISGDMRVNRVLSDEEVRAINEASGMYDLPRYSPLKRAEGGLAHAEELEEPELK